MTHGLSVTSRVLAFGGICLGGLCGGLIGWALGGLFGFGPFTAVLCGAFGAIATAGGTAVLAVLMLRATQEWQALPKGPDGRPLKRTTPRRS